MHLQLRSGTLTATTLFQKVHLQLRSRTLTATTLLQKGHLQLSTGTLTATTRLQKVHLQLSSGPATTSTNFAKCAFAIKQRPFHRKSKLRVKSNATSTNKSTKNLKVKHKHNDRHIVQISQAQHKASMHDFDSNTQDPVIASALIYMYARTLTHIFGFWCFDAQQAKRQQFAWTF